MPEVADPTKFNEYLDALDKVWGTFSDGGMPDADLVLGIEMVLEAAEQRKSGDAG